MKFVSTSVSLGILFLLPDKVSSEHCELIVVSLCLAVIIPGIHFVSFHQFQNSPAKCSGILLCEIQDMII